MSEQKSKILQAVALATLSIIILFSASYSFLPSESVFPLTPSPSVEPTSPPSYSAVIPTSTPMETDLSTRLPTPSALPSTNSGMTTPLPSPIEPSASTNNLPTEPVGLLFAMSPNPGVDGTLYVAQGNSISVNITLSSLSNVTELDVPIFLAIGAFQNQPLPGYVIIGAPPTPYSSPLPWPTSDVDSSTGPKPFTTTFGINPVFLKPMETKTLRLTIQAAQNATLGAYSIIIELGNWQQTHVGGTTFQLTVTPK